MFVYVVWYRTEYLKPKRNRFPHLTPKKRVLAQNKLKQDCLSKLQAKRWDTDNDYRIYRVTIPNNPPRILLSRIWEACEECGLDGPFWGQGQIAWQGQGGGPQKHVHAKIMRQISEKYIREKLDLLAQIRIIAGYQSLTEAFTLQDVPEEMREKWTALLTPEISRWKEYLASKGGEAYHQAMELLSTDQAKQAFLGDTENPLSPYMGEMKRNKKTDNIEFKVDTVRESGRAMMQCEKTSLNAIQNGVASVIVDTIAPTMSTEVVKQEIEGTELGSFTSKGRVWNNVLWG